MFKMNFIVFNVYAIFTLCLEAIMDLALEIVHYIFITHPLSNSPIFNYAFTIPLNHIYSSTGDYLNYTWCISGDDVVAVDTTSSP